MVGVVLSQLKPSEFSILSCEKGLGLRPRTFCIAKNGELLGPYPIRNQTEVNVRSVNSVLKDNPVNTKKLYDITMLD